MSQGLSVDLREQKLNKIELASKLYVLGETIRTPFDAGVGGGGGVKRGKREGGMREWRASKCSYFANRKANSAPKKGLALRLVANLWCIKFRSKNFS